MTDGITRQCSKEPARAGRRSGTEWPVLGGIAAVLLTLFVHSGIAAQEKAPASRTKIVLLGTGTPGADPDRSGPATAIVVDDTPYLIDFGPGVVRRAAGAVAKGVNALRLANLKVVFVTHIHSDHTAGYADLILTPWAAGRSWPLEVYGPRGIKNMTDHLLAAYRLDIDNRLKERGEKTVKLVNAHEIGPGVIYKDTNVTVRALQVKHGDLTAFGYRFETPDRTIVISGDTSPAESVVTNCNGCDVLIHEHYSLASFAQVAPEWQQYRLRHHTSTQQLAELATRARPGLLILYHRSHAGGRGTSAPESDVIEEMRKFYSGRWVSGHDLDIY